MNEHYALDPNALSDAREFKLLMDQFGLNTGRFLARFPQDWPTLLLNHLNAASDMDKKRALELLQRRKGCLMPLSAHFEPGSAWANNAALALERSRSLRGVIGQPGNGFGWPTPEQVLFEDDHALPSGQGAHVPMKAAGYADLARPLFLTSAEVILVDPYFTSRDNQGRRCSRRWPVLQALLKAAEAANTCQCLRLVLERRQIEITAGSEARLEEDLLHALTAASTSRLELEYELRDSVGHGRYLISIHGGLQFDRGFEEQSGGENHVHWLSMPELEPLLQRFARKTTLAMR